MHRDRDADPWKHAIRAACLLALLRANVSGLVAGGVPLCVDLCFRFVRPLEHYVPNAEPPRLAPGAPTWLTGKPDKDNLEKAVLDALGSFDGLPSLVWTDDRQVVTGRTTKRYVEPGEAPGVRVDVYRIEREQLQDTMTEDLARVVLSHAECWRLDRWRARMNLAEMADLLGIPKFRYKGWEDGVDTPARRIERITAGEWCWLLRIRHGFELAALATLCGLGSRWIDQAEHGAVDATALIEWWQRYLRALKHAYDEPALPPSGPNGVVRALPPVAPPGAKRPRGRPRKIMKPVT